MAWTHTPLPQGPHAPRAAGDLRTNQYKAVLLTGADTVVAYGAADTGSLAGCPVFVLVNAPNSGDACTLGAIGNTVKGMCAGSTYIGAFVAVLSGGGMTCGSFGSLNTPGNAFEAVNSGQLFALALRA